MYVALIMDLEAIEFARDFEKTEDINGLGGVVGNVTIKSKYAMQSQSVRSSTSTHENTWALNMEHV